MLVPSMVVAAHIDHQSVVDAVAPMCCGISTMQEFFCEGEGVEFWPWIVDAMELAVASWYEIACPSMWKLGIPRSCTLLLIHTITKNLNIVYTQCQFMVRALQRQNPI
jgi:hypothetical protein